MRAIDWPLRTKSQRYVVASCHVEEPLDDRVWEAFSRLQRNRPGGIPVAALMRLPHDDAGEDRHLWLARAREAQARAPFGMHIHWTSPSHARQTGGDPSEVLLREAAWLRSEGLTTRLFCGGRWYFDLAVAEACTRVGYADCTMRRHRPRYFGADESWAQLDAPATVTLPDGSNLVGLPSTHSPGEAIRAALGGALDSWTHLAFHDTDLVSPSRRHAVVAALRLLGHLGQPGDLAALAAGTPTARATWADVERGPAVTTTAPA